MELQQINLFEIPFAILLQKIKNSDFIFSYDYKKHFIYLENQSFRKIASIRLPLHLSLDSTILEENTSVLYLSIESGNAAICLQEGIENVYHTTFSAYMTRKKQGFSQIKYLKKKGKSRAGSRVRLAETVEFFEKINTLLQDLFAVYPIDRIAIHCSPLLIPYLHQSKIECPFSKNDERLYKIPVHIDQSNYTNLSGAIKKLMAPILFYDLENGREVAKLVDGFN